MIFFIKHMLMLPILDIMLLKYEIQSNEKYKIVVKFIYIQITIFSIITSQ